MTWATARSRRAQQRTLRGIPNSLTRLIAGGIFLLALAIAAAAQRLPVRLYTTADGLPSNQISCNHIDSHGFLWFCTAEGLSRFDGYTFTNYGVDQGLPDRMVTGFLETRNGDYWVGTMKGVAMFHPVHAANAPIFTVVTGSDSGLVFDLCEDVHGTVWISGVHGLFQLVREKGGWSSRRASISTDGASSENFLSDAEGNLWITQYLSAGHGDLWRLSASGKLDVFSDPFLSNRNRTTSVVQDRLGRIWLGTYRGLVLLTSHPQPGGKLIARIFADWHRPTSEAGAVFQASDGRIWVSAGGTQEIVTEANGEPRLRMFDPEGQGFSMEDRAGNLWQAATKQQRGGFVNFGRQEGLHSDDIRSLFEGVDGALYVVTGLHNRYIQRLDGDHFTAVAPMYPGQKGDWDWGGWGWGQTHFQDHLGQWWVATGRALLHYPKVKLEDLPHTTPEIIRSLPNIFRLYEDSRGDVWIASWAGAGRWVRSSGRFESLFQIVPTAFGEDHGGNVWIGHWGGGLERFHPGQQKGHEDWIVSPESGMGSIFSVFVDHAGRLWAGTTRGGLLRVDDPLAQHPTVRTYSMHEGLSSNDVRAVTGDHFGRIYFWTGRGVDRLNPESGAIRHYTEADGLVQSGADHNVAFCDRQGRLWFGFSGLSRLEPEPDRPAEPPPIRITKLRIRGIEYPVSELGEIKLSGLELQPNENQVQIEFASLNFAAGDVIRYQYKLEGADADWSPPSDLRVVNYPRLPSGHYRFLVRAVDADGLASPAAAMIAMHLLPPIWTRWWFLALCAALVISVAYVAYRYRVRQLLELERVRTRIATDLHDDIGSSLTQIAIMSEVAQKQSNGHSASEPLADIADLSRELVDSMSDIVWAINPKRDHLGDLAQRMRRFVSDVLEAADIEVVFHAPEQWAGTALSADLRREVFLVFKESVNNIVRHAECRRVEVTVDLHSSGLLVELRDDGRGFEVHDTNGHGHGLASMKERAARLGGSLQVHSEPGRGTTLQLMVPLGRATRMRHFASLRHS